MLILDNIEFKYPKTRGKKFGLAGISFAVQPGQIFILLGPNGAGKTTIIRILSGLILPQKGRVVVDGHDLYQEECKAHRAIGLVLGDERTFYYRLSGAQNLEFFGGLYGLRRSFLKKRVKEVLSLVGLEDNARLQFMRYSTGMKKRLSLARAILHNPSVLLLDEPNSGVDPESAMKIRGMISGFEKEGRTIFLTTHDMDEAERMSHTIGFIKEGSLVRVGPLDDYKRIIQKKRFVVEFAREAFTDSAVAGRFVEEAKKAVKGGTVNLADNRLVIDSHEPFDINSVLSLIVKQGLKVERANSVEPSLEEVFIELAK